MFSSLKHLDFALKRNKKYISLKYLLCDFLSPIKTFLFKLYYHFFQDLLVKKNKQQHSEDYIISKYSMILYYYFNQLLITWIILTNHLFISLLEMLIFRILFYSNRFFLDQNIQVYVSWFWGLSQQNIISKYQHSVWLLKTMGQNYIDYLGNQLCSFLI